LFVGGNFKKTLQTNNIAMIDIWNAVEQKLKDIAPNIFSSLNDGVTADQVAQLEDIIKAKLPDEFVEFYKVHNGQGNDKGGLIECEELLSFDRTF
jgi:cell wall assembly regulator SMI1